MERGCHMMDLETFSFQAPGFYARHGWMEAWVLDGIAHGIRRHHFRKELVGATTGQPQPNNLHAGIAQ